MRPGRRVNLRSILVVAQIAMSLVLLCGTGLLLRSLENASNIDIGFRSRGLLMMSIDPRVHGYSPERTTQFFRGTAGAIVAIARSAIGRSHRFRPAERRQSQRWLFRGRTEARTE